MYGKIVTRTFLGAIFGVFILLKWHQNTSGYGTEFHISTISKKKSPLFGKSVILMLSLTFGPLKEFDLISWVIPSIPVAKLKDCSFQFGRSHQKQTKHSGDTAIFFHSNFYDTSRM